jgi:hypothetical protein
LPDSQSGIDGLDPDGVPKARVILRPDAVRNAAGAFVSSRERDRLVEEIAALADSFIGLIGGLTVAAPGRDFDTCPAAQFPH